MKRLYDLIQERHSNEFLAGLFPEIKSQELKVHRDSGTAFLNSSTVLTADESQVKSSQKIAGVTPFIEESSPAKELKNQPKSGSKKQRKVSGVFNRSERVEAHDSKLTITREEASRSASSGPSSEMVKRISSDDSSTNSKDQNNLVEEAELFNKEFVQRGLNLFPLKTEPLESEPGTFSSFIESEEQQGFKEQSRTSNFRRNLANSSSEFFYSDVLHQQGETKSIFLNSKPFSKKSEEQRHVFRSGESNRDRASVARNEWSQRRF